MLEIKNISQGNRLQNINCHIPQGKLVGIMGANGSGKSTLLKSIAGILPLTSGEIWFRNYKLSAITTKQKSDLLVYLAQSPQIQWDLSVYDVITLALPNTVKDEYERVNSIAKQFSISSLLNTSFQKLSGGEKARVQLARCCIKDTPLLLADEPIAPLDPYYQIEIMELLKSLTPQKTCLVAIHHLDLAYRFCDEIILLDKGRLLANGKTQTVLTTKNLEQAFRISAQIEHSKKEIFGVRKAIK